MIGILALSLVLGAGAQAQPREVALKSGVTMKYVESGAKDAPPLILLHGLGDTKRSWTLVTPELARTHRVYALDQRGHGGTSAPPCCYALADLAYDVLSFMDAMKIDRAAVAGHSMGSFVAQYLAAHHPQRIRRVVLVGSADSPTEAELLEWLWDQVAAFGEKPGAAFIEEWQANPTPVDEEFLNHVKRETADVPLHVWKGVARSLMTDDQRRFVRGIEVPVLILAGENDPAFPRKRQEGLQRLLPHAQFKEYPRVGHNPHWEIPAVIAKDMRAFLDGP